MNSPRRKDPWQRLAAVARRSQDQRDAKAPYGFATRVAALAEVSPRRGGSLFERFALRAVGFAAVLALGSAVFSLTQAPTVTAPNADAPSELAADDPLAELVDA